MPWRAWHPGSPHAAFQSAAGQRLRSVRVASALAIAGIVFTVALIMVAVLEWPLPRGRELPTGKVIDFGPSVGQAPFFSHGWTLVGWTQDQARLLLLCSVAGGYEGETNAFIVEMRARALRRLSLDRWSDVGPGPAEEREMNAEFQRNGAELDRWVKENSPLRPSVCGFHGPGGRDIAMRGAASGFAEAEPPAEVPFDIRSPGRKRERFTLAIPKPDYPQQGDLVVLLPCWSNDGTRVVFIAKPKRYVPNWFCDGKAILLPQQ